MALADVVEEAQEPSALVYCPNSFPQLDAQLDKLAAVCRDKLRAQVSLFQVRLSLHVWKGN